MSPDPKNTLKIELVSPGGNSPEAEPKRRSAPKKKAEPEKKATPAKSKTGDAASASEKSPQKPSRKTPPKPAAARSSISVEAIEPVVKKRKAAKSPAAEPLAIEPAIASPAAEPSEELEQEAVVAELAREVEAEAEDEPGFVPSDEGDSEPPQKIRPVVEPQLERLQKILSRAGISSRRTAEEMILGGRVQVNGQIVSTLGAKADPARDHVRVDGKLLQGPERHRYFMLNKPKGYVTTVSDPEGRATVMKFFAGERERLYPVGRLDYLSEGLLLVTNDGDLANKLTRAASGVEKTYLVKVSGQPGEEMLEALREGVMIERGRPGTGSGRVRTAPARIRQVREGDNPWYEVIVIEGRNRELRKMFEEIGHHVEKIRRVGYGPLILDLEPGKVRELDAEEIRLLNLAGDGKLKTRRRRGPAPAQLSRNAGESVEHRKSGERPQFKRRPDSAPGSFRGRPGTDARPPVRRDNRAPERRESRFPGKPSVPGQPRFRPAEGSSRPFQSDRSRPRREQSSSDRPVRNQREPGSDSRPFSNRPASNRSFSNRPVSNRPSGPPRPPARPPREGGDFEPRRREATRPPEKRFESRPRNAPSGRTEKPYESDRRPAKKFTGNRPLNRAPAKRAFDRPRGPESGPTGTRRPGSPSSQGDAPRKKERWRDSYTGKNKGRPKPRKPE